MIELTPEQRRAVAQGAPVRVIDPATNDIYIVVRADVYERFAGPPEKPAREEVASEVQSTPPDAPSRAGRGPDRVRLRDLPTPPDVIEEAERWCKKYGWWGKRRRQEAEEQFKLQYYYGGQAIYVLDTPEGQLVIPIPEQYKDTPGLRYVLLTPEERPRACLTVPSRWRDDVSILS